MTSRAMMKPQLAKSDADQRRAAARRTAWIVAIVAVAIYLLFFLSQGLSH
ncbi:MAG TPA: hypothetical protein VLK26_10260 [Rudaea sp.]|nr:hypothetical protein [Rudaea sp.]